MAKNSKFDIIKLKLNVLVATELYTLSQFTHWNLSIVSLATELFSIPLHHPSDGIR